MVWQDVIIDRILTKDEIFSILIDAFKIKSDEIVVVKNIDEIYVTDEIKILCETFKVNAEFKMRLIIYIRDDKLVPINDKIVVGGFCELLHCKALISDSTTNPYSMLLIKGKSDIESVSINIEEHDDAEAYEVK